MAIGYYHAIEFVDYCVFDENKTKMLLMFGKSIEGTRKKFWVFVIPRAIELNLN